MSISDSKFLTNYKMYVLTATKVSEFQLYERNLYNVISNPFCSRFRSCTVITIISRNLL